jgi:hypothetical protein
MDTIYIYFFLKYKTLATNIFILVLEKDINVDR